MNDLQKDLARPQHRTIKGFISKIGNMPIYYRMSRLKALRLIFIKKKFI